MFKPGHYVTTEDTNGLPPGSRVRLIYQDDTEVQVARHDHAYSYSPHDFRRIFEHDFQGEERYFGEIRATEEQLAEAEREIRQALDDLEASDHPAPALGNGEADAAQALPANGHTLSSDLPSSSQLQMARENPLTTLQSVRSRSLGAEIAAKKAQSTLEHRAAQLKAILKERQLALEAWLRPLKALTKKANEVVWSLELYSGEHEKFTVIHEGENAPEGTPLTIRQHVLAMDEESAAMLDEGGMDGLNIAAFITWLQADFAHVEQLLPEPKGMMALVPRWQNKDYENVWEAKAAADANAVTYFLLRNGQNVHLMTTAFYAGPHLIPPRHEFSDTFADARGESPQPGTRRYEKLAQEKNASQRHYFRIALILQGLLDRTAIFRPYPTDEHGNEIELNVINPSHYQQGHFEVIEDDTTTLQDQRETFRDWLRRVNSSLDLGMRIVGDFGSQGFKEASRLRDESWKTRHSRLHPVTASWPRSGVPHLITQRRPGASAVSFTYERQDEVYRPSEYGERRLSRAEQRASCTLHQDDSFIINIDHPEVTREVIQDFLSRRGERKNYLTLVPLLRRALQAKEEERRQEAPLREFLTTHLELHEPGLTPGEAQTWVEEVITTFKRRRKDFRPITDQSRETETFRELLGMLERHSALRAERQHREKRGDYQRVLDTALGSEPTTILVTHHGDNEYRAYVPHREYENVYCHVLIYRTNGKSVRLAERRDWQTLTRSVTTSHALYRTARLDAWSFYPNTDTYPTDAELPDIHRHALEHLKKKSGEWGTPAEHIICLAYDPRTRIHHLFDLKDGNYTDHRSIRYSAARAVLQREQGKLSAVTFLTTSEASNIDWKPRNFTEGTTDTPDFRPWEPGAFLDHGERHSRSALRHELTIVTFNKALVAHIDRQYQELIEKQRQDNTYHALAQKYVSGLKSAHETAAWERARQKFLRTYGQHSAHLWEEHRKTLDKREVTRTELLYFHQPLQGAIQDHLKRGLEVAGLSVAEVLTGAGIPQQQWHGAEPEVTSLILPTLNAVPEE